jgi:aryl carrier-like protein
VTVQENTDYSTGVGVDFSIFITLLANPQSSDEGNLINLLQQGLDSWRLPMIAHMHRSANADKDVERISAITWIEKNRVFLRAAINQNPSLLEWLEHPQQADMQSIMQHFTTQLYTLLDEKSLLDIHGENAIIDVRKVLIISSNISSNYSYYI